MTENEARLELFADLIEPAGEIFGDPEVSQIAQRGKIAKAVSIAIKKHKAAVIEMMARLEGQDPATYKVPNPIGLAVKMVNLFNDPEMQMLFQSQTPSESADASGSVTENIEDGAQ